MTRAKFQYIRSPALLKACREIPCQHCGIEDGTVVAAHSNESRNGKGRGIKASDIYIAALCAKCHTKVDSSYCLTQQERTKIWTDAHIKTVQELTQNYRAGTQIGDLYVEEMWNLRKVDKQKPRS